MVQKSRDRQGQRLAARRRFVPDGRVQRRPWPALVVGWVPSEGEVRWERIRDRFVTAGCRGRPGEALIETGPRGMDSPLGGPTVGRTYHRLAGESADIGAPRSVIAMPAR